MPGGVRGGDGNDPTYSVLNISHSSRSTWYYYQFYGKSIDNSMPR